MYSDYLPKTNIKIKQRNDMFKMNTDTHLLGNFIQVKEEDTVLDIGCNNGALMLYASLFNPKKLVGIDIFDEAIECAKENLLINSVKGECINCKVQNFNDNPYDVIICNPPYFNTKEDLRKNQNEYLKAARHEDYLSLEELFESANRLLKETGRMYLVHRPSRIQDIILVANKYGLQIEYMQFVYDAKKDDSTAVLCKIKKGKNCICKVGPIITINR